MVNNSVISDPKEVSDVLADHFSEISSKESFVKILEMLPMKENILTLIQIIQNIIMSLLPCKSRDMLFNIQKISVLAKIQFLQIW